MREILFKKFPENLTAVQHFGDLLMNYESSGFASPNLRSELATQENKKFWSFVWEAILYHHLVSLNFSFVPSQVKKRGQNGPDFGILYEGKKIWIEAIVPEAKGISEEYLRPPSSDTSQLEVKTEPHEEKLLRWTAAIKEKRDKFSKYLVEGVVSKSDCLVIAVNSCCLQDFAPDDNGISQLPYAVEATFPIGPLSVPLDLEGKQAGPARNIWRGAVVNKNGKEISTGNFLDAGYSQISAVIGAHQRDLFNSNLRISVVHNPLATSALPVKILGASKEFTCNLSKHDFTLSRIV